MSENFRCGHARIFVYCAKRDGACHCCAKPMCDDFEEGKNVLYYKGLLLLRPKTNQEQRDEKTLG